MKEENIMKQFDQWAPQEKIIVARKLLHEATCELRKDKKEEENNDLCKCGHKRKDHSVSYSINYTKGTCFKCNCKNFVIK